MFHCFHSPHNDPMRTTQGSTGTPPKAHPGSLRSFPEDPNDAQEPPQGDPQRNPWAPRRPQGRPGSTPGTPQKQANEQPTTHTPSTWHKKWLGGMHRAMKSYAICIYIICDNISIYTYIIHNIRWVICMYIIYLKNTYIYIYIYIEKIICLKGRSGLTLLMW